MEGDETIKQPPDEVAGPHIGDTIQEFIAEETPPSSSGTKTPLTSSRLPSTSGSRRSSRSAMDSAPEEVKKAALDPAHVLNQYVLVQQIGQGGMGSVWKAWDTHLARWVAIKFLNVTEDESVTRFHREAQLAARLRHPNICAVFEANEAKGLHYLVMDFIEGTSIGKAKMSMRQLVDAMTKVCRALDYAHKNAIIHRDLKPANIMVTKEGEPFVTDFGLAKVMASESSISLSGAVLGTPAYMPPEQASGKIQALDNRSDIYSLGATLYMLTTGRAPFEADNATALLFMVTSADPVPPRKINDAVSPAVEAIILKAMDKDKRKRYDTAAAMADDLQRYLNDQPVVAKAPGLLSRAVKRVRKSPWIFAAAALLLIAGGVTATLLFLPEIRTKLGLSKPTPAKEPTAKEPEKESPEQKWREGFRPIQGKLDPFTFRESPATIQEAKSHLATLPAGVVEEIAGWFGSQADQLPAEPWPKSAWKAKGEDATRLLAWCSAIQSILEGLGAAFDPVRQKLAPATAWLPQVRDYRGNMTLRIYVSPYAEVKSLKSGDVWVVRNGAVEGGAKPIGEGLCTPLVLENVDIGDFAIVLAHPELGEKELKLSGGDLKHGGSYLLSGSLRKPEGIRLR